MPETLNTRVDHLADVVEELASGVGEANDIARSNRSWLRTLGVSLAVAVLIGVAALGGAYYLIEQNNRKWCGTLAVLTSTRATPASEQGRHTIAELTELKKRFGCP